MKAIFITFLLFVSTITVKAQCDNTLTYTGATTFCSSGTPTIITGSVQQGGLSIQWQRSIDGTNFTDISGANSSDYEPIGESASGSILNVYYRRLVGEGEECISNVIFIQFTPTLVNTITTTSMVFCSPVSGGSQTLSSTGVSGGTGSYTYNWQVSTDNGGSWNDASGTRNNATYTLPAITNSTAFPIVYQFRRQITSGACTSNSEVRIVTVNPAIGSNTITAPPSPVCFGTAPGAFGETTPTGGDGIYTYTWQRATNSGFTGATVVGSTQSFTETSTTLSAATYYYRRIVTTIGTGCSNVSTTVTVVVQPAILNTIGGTQTICHNTTPSTLTNSTVSGGAGAGTHTYLWQVNINGAGWNNAPGDNNRATYSPPALTTGSSVSIYSYRRLVSSGSCAANTSSTVTVTVKPYAALSNITNSSGEIEILAVTYGQNVVITPVVTGVTNPVFKFWTDAAKTTQVVTGGNVTVTTSSLTETKLAAGVYSSASGGTFPTRYYVSVSGTNYCDNQIAVPVKITVNKATLTVTADAKTKIYGNANPSLTVTTTGYQYSETFATASVTGTAPSISTTAVDQSPISTPTYPITLTGGAYTAANYNFNYVNGALTVTPRVITVMAKSYNKQYATTQTFATDGSEVNITSGTLASLNTLNAATVTSTGAIATANVAGNSYPVLITNGSVKVFDGNNVDVTSNYTINRLNGVLTVTKIPLTYRAISVSKQYGSTVSFLSNGTAITLESGSLVANQVLTGATVTSLGQTDNAAVAGSPYTTTIIPGAIVIKDANGTGADVTANYDLTLLTGTLTISAQPITIKANNDTKTYGDEEIFLTNGSAVAVSAGGPLLSGENITAATLTSTGSVASATVAGSTYPIVISSGTVQIFNGATNVTSNYIITLADGALTVSRRAITVTPNFVSKAYGSTYSYGTTAAAVAVTGAGVAIGQTLASVVITSLGTVNTAQVITSPYYTSTIGVGTVVIRNADNVDVTANYTITRAAGQLEVTKAALTITAANKGKTYDGSVFAGPYTIASYSGFVNNEDENTAGVFNGALGYGGTAQTAIDASGIPYTIIPSGLTAKNYTLNYVSGGLTINARDLVINSSAMTKVYGSTRAYSLTDVSVDASTPLVSGDDLFSISQTSTLGDPAKANVTPMGSDYTVSISNAVIRRSANNITSNYNVSYNSGTLKVTPLAINVKAKSVSKVYGDTYIIPDNGSNVSTNGTSLLSGQTFTASSVSIANNGDQASAPVIPASGSYTLSPLAVTIRDGATNVTSNYNITYETDVLTINKRQITLTAKDAAKTYGTLHTFANTPSEVNVTGLSSPALAPNEAISALALTSIGALANAAANVTTYPVVITNGSVIIKDGNGTGSDVTPNYDITLVNGGLTINRATLTFTAKAAGKVYGDGYTFATDGTATTMTGSLVNGNTIAVHPVVTASNSGATATAPVAGTYATQVTNNSVAVIDPANSNADVTSNYNITLVPGTFTIAKRQITLTAKDVTKTYGTLHTFANTPLEVNVTGLSSSALAPNEAISALALTSTGVPANATVSAIPYPIILTNGSIVIKDANGTGADVTDNYDIASVNGELTINKATQNITFDVLPPKTNTSPDFVLSATVSSGLPISYTSSDATVAIVYQDVADANQWKVKVIGAGTTNITAKQGGDGNYLAAADVIQSLLVTTVLPVTLIDYTAKIANYTTRLEWKLSSEKDNRQFIIYRSGSDKKFVPIGEVLSLGNTNVVRSYSFTDKQPLNGENYYKLSQIDLDGTEKELGIRILNFNFQAATISVYPNPTLNKVNVVFQANAFQQLTVVDLLGKVLQRHILSPGAASATLNLENYPTGTYVLVLTGNQGLKEIKVVKQ